MRFLLETHRRSPAPWPIVPVALLLALASCQHQSPPASTQGYSPTDSSASPTLSSLGSKEFEEPQNPTLKLAIAQEQWCNGQRGLAVENWLWVSQFASSSPQAEESRSLLQLATIDDKKPHDDEIAKRLLCVKKAP